MSPRINAAAPKPTYATQKHADATRATSTATDAQLKVATLSAQVAQLERQLATLKQQASNPFDAGASAAKQQLDGVELKLAGAQTELAAAKKAATSTTKASVSAQQEANLAAVFELKPPPFRNVDTTVASLTRDEAAAAAISRFQSAKSPYDALVTVQHRFALNGDPQVTAALWNEVKKQLPELAKHGGIGELRALAAIAQDGGVDVERDIAHALAKASTGLSADAFARGHLANLRQTMRETGRGDLAHRLIAELHAVGNPQAASTLAAGVASELKALRADFDAKQKKIEGLNAKLGMLVAGFGPMMTDAQKRKAIDAFQTRHREAYGDHARAAEKLTRSLDLAGALTKSTPQTEGEKALKKEAGVLLERTGVLSDSKAGEAALKAAMAKEAKGEPSWISSAMAHAKTAKTGESLVSTLGTAVMRTLALDAAKLTQRNLPLAMEKVADIARYAKLMGVDPAKADALGGAMVGMLKGRDGAGAALNKAVMDIEGTPLVPADGAFSKSLKGIGIALSAYSLATDGLGDGAIDKLKNINSGLQVGADSVALGLSIIGRGEAIKGFAEGASKKLGVVAGAFDLASGIHSLAKGNFQEAGTAFMSSAGALMMLTPGGQIPGVLLTVGSMIAGWVFASRKANAAEAADEADAKAFLKAAGVHDSIAAPLSDLLQKNRRNVGPFLTQLEAHLKLKPGQLLQHLNKPELASQVRELVVIIKAIEPAKDGSYKASSFFGDAAAKSNGYQQKYEWPRGVQDHRPKTLEAVADWMKSKRLL